RDLEDFARALEVYVVAVAYVAQRGGVVRALRRRAEDLPERGVFRAETPEGEARRMILTGSAHLVVDGHGVEEPDGVARAVLFFVVEVRVARRRVELDLGLRVARREHGLLEGDFRGLAARARPVVAVVADADDGLRGVELAHAPREELVEPALG